MCTYIFQAVEKRLKAIYGDDFFDPTFDGILNEAYDAVCKECKRHNATSELARIKFGVAYYVEQRTIGEALLEEARIAIEGDEDFFQFVMAVGGLINEGLQGW